MDILKNRFLWIPPLVFAGIFLVDKIFFIPAVMEHTVLWMKVEPPFYASRIPLLEQLNSEYAQRKKRGERFGVILGTSRTGEFSTETFARHIPRSYTYNFSAPFGCPAYHYYWLSRMLDAGSVPDFVVIEAESTLFSAQAINYSLSYSLDPEFVLRHLDWNRTVPKNVWQMDKAGFSFDEAETYFLKQTFALYRHPFDPNAIKENSKTIILPDEKLLFKEMPRREFRRAMVAGLTKVNRENLGGIPNPLSANVPPARMEADAENLKNQYLAGFIPSPTQIGFFKKMIRTLGERKIPTVVYWPLVSSPYRRKTVELGLLESFQKPLVSFLQAASVDNPKSRIVFLDPNDDSRVKCRQFADAHHLMGACFDDITALLGAALFPRKSD